MAGHEDEVENKTWPLSEAGMASPDASDCKLNNPIKTKNIFSQKMKQTEATLSTTCIDELIFVAVKIIGKSLQANLD